MKSISAISGSPAKGCKFCVKGEKMVLFITGLCAKNCYFCPVSDNKMYKDVVYANEWRIQNDEEVLEEARLTEAKGAGITGGDALMRVDRCVHYIKLLKDTFGKKFHIHLYTPLKIVTGEKLKKLCDAGLDEIRFHPDLDDRSLWNQLSLAAEFNWDVGVEIPCIPGKKKEILNLMSFARDKVKFFNLNELEFADTKLNKLSERGFKSRSLSTSS